MSPFSALNKTQFPELLTANLTFMGTHKVTKSANQGRFLPDILQGKSKAHNPSNSGRNLPQVPPMKIPPIPQRPGNRLGLGLGEGQREHPEDVHPTHGAQARGERPLPSSPTSLPSWLH